MRLSTMLKMKRIRWCGAGRSSPASSQFWSEIIWQDDYLFVDMPCRGQGRSDGISILPVDGILVVKIPMQELVSMISRAVNMARLMKVPSLASLRTWHFSAVLTAARNTVFRESHLSAIAAQCDLPVLGHIPLLTCHTATCDRGQVETLENHWLDGMMAGTRN